MTLIASVMMYRLASDEREPYLKEYTAAVDAAYAVRKDGKRLFPFPRLFVVAVV